ncbi:MAG: tetratricopeptide repeat protein [Chloroflexota bacterium]|nr:tetratricopeptide repeat protein [Chloroflexota bacterium]
MASPSLAPAPAADRGPSIAAATLTVAAKAVDKLEASLRADPTQVAWYAQLGEAYLQRARETVDPTYYTKAQKVIDEALRRDPNNLEALIGRGTLLLAQHRFRDALAVGQQARRLNATIPRILGIIADAQVELGMYPESVDTIQKMVDLRPDLSSYSRVSYARELHGDLPGAIDAMQMAIEGGGPAAENTEYLRVQLGTLYFAAGDLPEAESAYNEALLRLPGYAYALAGLARVKAARGETDDAIELYHRAIAAVPLPEFIIGLGEVQQAAGRMSDAKKQYDLVRAIEQLFQANGVRVDLELALFDADHGADPSAAVATARLGYDQRPSIKGDDVLGWALYRDGQLSEAATYADRAVRLGTRDPMILFHAGMIANANGQTSLARDRLTAALALSPAFSPLYAPEAQRALGARATP